MSYITVKPGKFFEDSAGAVSVFIDKVTPDDGSIEIEFLSDGRDRERQKIVSGSRFVSNGGIIDIVRFFNNSASDAVVEYRTSSLAVYDENRLSGNINATINSGSVVQVFSGSGDRFQNRLLQPDTAYSSATNKAEWASGVKYMRFIFKPDLAADNSVVCKAVIDSPSDFYAGAALIQGVSGVVDYPCVFFNAGELSEPFEFDLPVYRVDFLPGAAGQVEVIAQ